MRSDLAPQFQAMGAVQAASSIPLGSFVPAIVPRILRSFAYRTMHRPSMTHTSLYAPVFGTVADAIESIIAGVPPTREHAAKAPEIAARALARKAAVKAAALSGTLALPPG